MAKKDAMLALSMRACWAEAVMNGTKDREFRSRSTNVRGRVLLYSSKTRYSRTEEASLTEELGLDVAALPRGVIVGSAEILDVQKLGEGDYAWILARPKRARKLVAPTRQPLPVFFRPF